MKKAVGKLAKKAMTTVAVGNVSVKVKEEVEKKIHSYKKKIALLALEFGFFLLGFNFIMLGVVGYLSKSFPEELIYLILGLLLVLLGFILSQNLNKK